MAEKILFGICAFTLLATATILLIGYGELQGARQCHAVVAAGVQLP